MYVQRSTMTNKQQSRKSTATRTRATAAKHIFICLLTMYRVAENATMQTTRAANQHSFFFCLRVLECRHVVKLRSAARRTSKGTRNPPPQKKKSAVPRNGKVRLTTPKQQYDDTPTKQNKALWHNDPTTVSACCKLR